jgi:hypothetical protein
MTTNRTTVLGTSPSACGREERDHRQGWHCGVALEMVNGRACIPISCRVDSRCRVQPAMAAGIDDRHLVARNGIQRRSTAALT